MSLPIPRMELPLASRAPSPPVEPPGVFFKFKGFSVCPYIGLLQSKLRKAEEKGLGDESLTGEDFLFPV